MTWRWSARDHLEPAVVIRGGFATHCNKGVTPTGDGGVSAEGASMELSHRIRASWGDWEESLRWQGLG